MTDLARLSATETALAIRERRVSATEVMQAAIKRIEAADPKLNAFVFTAFDDALGEAKKQTRPWRAAMRWDRCMACQQR